MSPRSLKSDDSVFARTTKGQAMAIGMALRRQPHEMKVLLMVNGFTPLGTLQALTPDIDFDTAINNLIELGLITPDRPGQEVDSRRKSGHSGG